jgi:hypothetical protein
MKRKILPDLTVEYVLSRVSEEQIFSKYVCEVEFSGLIRNPMRKDRKATAGFYYNSKNRLVFHDFNGYFHGDCFAAVQKMYGLGFKDCLLKIAGDFGLIDGTVNVEKLKVKFKSKKREETRIDIKIKDFTDVEKAYWRSYNLNSKILNKYKVFSLSKVWVNGEIRYNYKSSDPAFAYYFGNGKYKIYFPERDEYRFLSNTDMIQGFEQLPDKYDFLVLTKSLKDIMIFDLLGVPAIAPQAEGNILSEDIIKKLQKRFPKIVSNYDFDYAGVRGANRLKKAFDIQPLFLTNGRFKTIDYEAKDISDYLQKHGLEKTKELINEVYNKII